MSEHTGRDDNAVLDDSEIMRQAFEEPMNAKHGSQWMPVVVASLIVSVATSIFNHVWDKSENRDTAYTSTEAALASLNVKIEGLRDEIKQLREQPYVRREEFEGRLSGLDQRVSNIERNQQSNRSR